MRSIVRNAQIPKWGDMPIRMPRDLSDHWPVSIDLSCRKRKRVSRPFDEDPELSMYAPPKKRRRLNSYNWNTVRPTDSEYSRRALRPFAIMNWLHRQKSSQKGSAASKMGEN